MGDLVNLRRARKLKERADADASAVANRLLHGRSKGERRAQAMVADRAARLLDGAKLSQPEPAVSTLPDGNGGRGGG